MFSVKFDHSEYVVAAKRIKDIRLSDFSSTTVQEITELPGTYSTNAGERLYYILDHYAK